MLSARRWLMFRYLCFNKEKQNFNRELFSFVKVDTFVMNELLETALHDN